LKNWVLFTGGLILLISWITRTFLFERWNRRLADIRAARSDYFTYQSNNALFSAVTKTANRELWDELWDLQNRNYEYGLTHLRDVLSKQRQHHLDQKIHEMSHKDPYLAMGEHGYRAAEVVVVQEELLKEKAAIELYEHHSEIAFWFLYFAGSAIILMGNLFPE
jgi:hypothetical protein